MQRLRFPDLLVAILLLSILVGVAQIPMLVLGERFEAAATFRELGEVRFHLDRGGRTGAEAVRQVLDGSPEDSVVLFRGDWRNAMEFVPTLIAPRLLVDEGACPRGADAYLGRPLATGLVGGVEGVLVLVGHRDHIDVEVRSP